jgi:hypothetical protein
VAVIEKQRSMNGLRSTRRSRRKWIAVASVILIGFIIAVSIFVSPRTEAPRVTATFAGLTNTAAGAIPLFKLTNESPLSVHVYAQQIDGSFALCRTETVPPDQSITIRGIIPIAPRTTGAGANTNPVALPVSARFYLRRQDTSLEEAREMVDSVLRSMGISIPNLNPGSSRNEFQVETAIQPGVGLVTAFR